MPTEMNFGPKWIRDMYGERSVNDGANHATERSGIQMATHRYGYEEMLGLIPIDLGSFDLLQGQEFHLFEPREPSFRQPVMPVQNTDFQKNSFTTSRKMRGGENEFERTSTTNRGVENFRRIPEPTPDPPRILTQESVTKEPPDRESMVTASSTESRVIEPPSEPVIDVPQQQGSVPNTAIDEPELVTCEEIEKMFSSRDNNERANSLKTEDENDNFFVPESRVGIGIECREIEENAIFNMPLMPSFNFSSLLHRETDVSNLAIVEPSVPEPVVTEAESSSIQAIGSVLNFKQPARPIQCVGSDPIWHYIDPRGNEQGPFSNESMSKWFDNNYFPDTLPIRTKIQKDFRPLKEYIALYGQAPFDEECSSHLMFGNQHPRFSKEEALVDPSSRPFFGNDDPMNHNHFLPSFPSELGNLNLQTAFSNHFNAPEIPNPQTTTVNNNEAINHHFNLPVSSSLAPAETNVANVSSISTVPDSNSLSRSKKAWDAAPFGATTKSDNNHSDSKRGNKRNQKNAKNTQNNNDAARNSVEPVSNGIEIEDQVNKFFQSFEETSTNTKSEKSTASSKKNVKVNSRPQTTDENALLSSMLETACIKEKSRTPQSSLEVTAPGSHTQKQTATTQSSFVPSLADIQNEQQLSYANEPPPVQPVMKKEPRPVTSNTSPWNIVHDSYTPIDLSTLINSSNGDTTKNAKRIADQNFSSIASLVRDFENDELTLNNQMQYPQIPKSENQKTAQLSSLSVGQAGATGSAAAVSKSSLLPSSKVVNKETGGKKQGNAPNTAASKKNKKEKQHAKSVKNLFNQKSAAGNAMLTPEDEFHGWCINQVFSIDTEAASAIDIPTFVEMLKEFDSPYEIHSTIREYLGETKECQEFAADFVKRKNKLRPNSMRDSEPLNSQLAHSVQTVPNIALAPSPAQEQTGHVAPAPKVPPQPNHAQSPQKTVLASSNWASVNPNPPPFELPKPVDADGNRNSKKGKQRKGQKINPAALLQISSKPAENRKIGEIDNA